MQVTSDCGDGDVGVAGGESCQVVGIVGEDDAATEADRGRDDERVDGLFAACTCRGEEVTGNSSGARPRGHDLREAACEDRVNGVVRTAASVQLDQDCRRDSYREVPVVRASECSAHELVTLQGLSRACERG